VAVAAEDERDGSGLDPAGGGLRRGDELRVEPKLVKTVVQSK
jgi:hypothetical protein